MARGVRCTASGQERAVNREEWSEDQGTCPDCGGIAPFWVRNADLAPRLKIKAHNAPPGVTPAPNAHSDALFVAQQAPARPPAPAASESLGDLYDRDPDRFRREVEKLRDRAILPPPSYEAQRTVSGSLRLAYAKHRVEVDAEFLLDLLAVVEQQMLADGRQPLGPGPYDQKG